MLLFSNFIKIKLFEGSVSLRFCYEKPTVKLVRKPGLSVSVGYVAVKWL